MAVTRLLQAGTWKNSERSLPYTNFHYAFLKTKWWHVFLVHYNCWFGWMCPSFRLLSSCLLRQDAVVCHCASTWGNLTPSPLRWTRHWKSLVISIFLLTVCDFSPPIFFSRLQVNLGFLGAVFVTGLIHSLTSARCCFHRIS